MSIEGRAILAENILENSYKIQEIMDKTIDKYPDAYYHIVGLKYDLNLWQEQVILSCLLRNFTADEYEFNNNVKAWKDIARQVEFFWLRRTSEGWEEVEELKEYEAPKEFGKFISDYCRIMRGLIQMAREENN